MSVDEEFTAALQKYWPHETLTTLRQIQALYGAIEEASGSDTDMIVPEEFQLYVTPGELSTFTTSQDEENRIVTVQVDLSGDEPQLAGIDVSPLHPDAVSKLGFSRFPWGRGIDHSITRRGAKGGSSRETVQTYCLDCLGRWTNADGREAAVGQVAETHPDGWVIEALQQLSERENLDSNLEDELWPQLGSDEKPRVVATVAVRLDPADLEHTPVGQPEDGFYYPGQVHVFNAAMQARKEQKLAEKNSDVPSRGEGTCLVTGADAEVFGTAEDPLAFFTVQHTEKFPNLQREHAWRAHPVSAEAALLIQSGSSLIEQCRRTRWGRGVYTIPYFTRMDATRAALLREAVERSHESTESQMAAIQDALEDVGEDAALGDLRYYTIAVRNDSGDINVLHEVPDATIQPVRTIAEAHIDVLTGSSFSPVAGFQKLTDWQPITSSTDRETVVQSVTGGYYATGTLATSTDEGPATDDAREWFTFSLLTGEPIPVDRLFDEYVDRLAQERADDDESRLSENHLKAQYAQLEALARAGLLVASEAPELTEPSRMIDDTSIPSPEQFLTDKGGISIPAVKEYRLQRFIEERPAFEDPSRRGAFLAGVLVGQLGAYQANPQKRDMNRTALVQYPAEQMSGDRITRFVPELVQKANVYATEDDHTGASLFPELEDVLPEALEDASIDGWSIPLSDLRFHYAVGQLYGKRSTNRAFDLREEIARKADIDLETTTESTNQ